MSVGLGTSGAGTIISGVTRDCFDDKEYHPEQVDIYFFDAANSPRLMGLLDDLTRRETRLTPDNIDPFLEVYQRLVRLVRSSKPLAHTKSDHNGSYRATIPSSVAKVIIVGTAEREDEPYYYASLRLDVKAQSQHSVVLDFVRKKDCAAR